MTTPTPSPDVPADVQVLSVSQFTAEIKDLLEAAFPQVWVAGEISNFSRPQSGHCYFTLKDDRASLRAVVWRGTASRLPFELQDGLEVICLGHADVYAPRGSYQLVVEQLLPKGVGALELALRKLRDRLQAEGLFDPQRKRPLPAFPKRIGFVTSPTGAAIRDFLEVLRRRWQAAEVLVIPTRVQGKGASQEIAAGIAAAARVQPPLDVLVIGRGGGSLEDLWAFNEEATVRAIAASTIPTISAVGHEIDVTLADMAADVRALTPSEAAERVVPSSEEVLASLRTTERRLRTLTWRRAELARSRVDGLASRRVFRRPLETIHERQRRIDDLAGLARRLLQTHTTAARGDLATLSGKLESLSPLSVLARGYSLTRLTDNNRPIRTVAGMQAGDRITTQLAEGQIISQIEHLLDGE